MENGWWMKFDGGRVEIKKLDQDANEDDYEDDRDNV